MEDGVKGDTAKPKEAKCTGKAGWVKKSSGKFLASYKDRYIQLEKTEIAVYENEDLQNCLERVDLENYEKCHELRSAFKKKNRLVLIRSPKSGNKVHDVKIQAQNPEDKEAWIKALSDGISRAKNKVFDEVANSSSDGILRLDLDAVDRVPNGTHQVNADVGATKETVKPPMPPSKLSGNLQDIQEEEPTPPKKVVKPPMPPSKGNKPSSPAEGETPKEATQETEPATPPLPPNKPSNSSEGPDSTHASPTPSPSQSPPPPGREPLKPPAPPSKDKKPVQSASGEAEGPETEGDEETPEEACMQPDSSEKTASDEDIADQKGPVLATPQVQDSASSSITVEEVGNPATGDVSCAETVKSTVQWTNPTEPSPEPSKKILGPPALPKNKPQKAAAVEESASPNNEGVPATGGTGEHLVSLEGTDQEELKSADSSQRSDEETKNDENTRAVAPSDSQVRLLENDGATKAEPTDCHTTQKQKPVQAAARQAKLLKQAQIKRSAQPTSPPLPLKPSSKGKSASMGDLLSESAPHSRSQPVEEPARSPPVSDMNELRSKVALELDNTVELLDSVSSRPEAQCPPGGAGSQGDLSPEELLLRAVEKLKKADQFLQEAKSLREAGNTEKKSRRLSW